MRRPPLLLTVERADAPADVVHVDEVLAAPPHPRAAGALAPPAKPVVMLRHRA